MNSPEVKASNRAADHAATNLTRPQAAARMKTSRTHGTDVIAKTKIALD